MGVGLILYILRSTDNVLISNGFKLFCGTIFYWSRVELVPLACIYLDPNKHFESLELFIFPHWQPRDF